MRVRSLPSSVWRFFELRMMSSTPNEMCPKSGNLCAFISPGECDECPHEQSSKRNDAMLIANELIDLHPASEICHRAALALRSLERENQSLRAQCGLRQIQGYNEGKAAALAASSREEA